MCQPTITPPPTSTRGGVKWLGLSWALYGVSLGSLSLARPSSKLFRESIRCRTASSNSRRLKCTGVKIGFLVFGFGSCNTRTRTLPLMARESTNPLVSSVLMRVGSSPDKGTPASLRTSPNFSELLLPSPSLPLSLKLSSSFPLSYIGYRCIVYHQFPYRRLRHNGTETSTPKP